MNLHVDHEQGDDPFVIVMQDADTGERRWYDVMVLSNMLKEDRPLEEVWFAGATHEEMFELNTLINFWRNR